MKKTNLSLRQCAPRGPSQIRPVLSFVLLKAWPSVLTPKIWHFIWHLDAWMIPLSQSGWYEEKSPLKINYDNKKKKNLTEEAIQQKTEVTLYYT